LHQYTEKSKTLLHVGFLGHFNAGKSSTINSLVGEVRSSGERLTGLHPTDKAVTLITHPQNSNDLIGAHTRGELDVGSSLVDADILKEVVVIDTPGSGDPLIVEEMVRDFLPICDRIIYTFSATMPLDESDLPILNEVHRELPFIPLRIVVTRGEVFRVDPLKPMTDENSDQPKIDTFTGDLISRLAASVHGLNVAQEDILIVDNLWNYNIDRLRRFILPEVVEGTTLPIQLHTHKVAYFIRNAKTIRTFFVEYLDEKIDALEQLMERANSTHLDYQRAVPMANSKLTETWRAQIRSIVSKQNGNSDWVADLKFDDHPSSTFWNQVR
jgi:hypothetical protein